jgi:thiol-disulfide isomerase/thioredoxin
MKKMRLGLLFLSVLGMVTTNFSGCKGGYLFSVGANGKNDSKISALANEPEVTFKDLQGNTVTLASLKGKVVLVDFWATWCEPCQVEIPSLIELQQKYADKGFTIVGVAMDEEGKKIVDPFVKVTQYDVGGQKMLMNYPIVLGNDDIADQFGGLLGYPTNIILTRDGKIAKKFIGLADQDELESQIKKLL